jgi:hypothetical protein
MFCSNWVTLTTEQDTRRPEGQKSDSTDFAQNMIGTFAQLYDSEGRQAHQRGFTLHFANALTHNTQSVLEHLEACSVSKMDHLPYVPALSETKVGGSIL